MAVIYARLILKGIMIMEQVPDHLRTEVEESLNTLKVNSLSKESEK